MFVVDFYVRAFEEVISVAFILIDCLEQVMHRMHKDTRFLISGKGLVCHEGDFLEAVPPKHGVGLTTASLAVDKNSAVNSLQCRKCNSLDLRLINIVIRALLPETLV